MSLRIVVEAKGGGRIIEQLSRAAAMAKNPHAASLASAEWLAAQTVRRFEQAGTPSRQWAALSRMTKFLRRHRANAPRKSDMPGSDSGRLRGSFIGEAAPDGTSFGAGTNVDYAADFNDGAPSRANDVSIAPFIRRYGTNRRDSQTGGFTLSKGKVKGYVMHMKAGHPVEPRPFFPKGMGELASWGYLEKLRQIFAIEFKSVLGGTA